MGSWHSINLMTGEGSRLALRVFCRVVAVLSLSGFVCPAVAGFNSEELAFQLTHQPEGCKKKLQNIESKSFENIVNFYDSSGYQPLWQNAARYAQLRRQLALLVEDGLDPDEYLMSDQLSAQSVCDELLATHSYLSALKDLGFGRLQPSGQEVMWQARTEFESVDSVVLQWAKAGVGNVAGAFDLARPVHPLYQQLRSAYQVARQKGWRSWGVVSDGPLIRQGYEDERLPAVRARLVAQGYLDEEGPESAAVSPLFQAIKAFQADHSIKVDGIVGPQTIAAMNVPLQARWDQVKINLERLRWLSHLAEPDMVLVDIAGANVSLYQDGTVQWSTRAQVGRFSRATPLLFSRLTHLTFNPTWTVPPTIFRHDKLPEIRKDIRYLEKNHIRVLDLQGQELNPETVDWRRPVGIVLRQDAGPGSPLGKVALRFPNPFSVYLHDTPNRQLFDSVLRNFSSGCVRVENAEVLADKLIGVGDEDFLKRVALVKEGSDTRNITLPKKIAIMLAYWTAEGSKGNHLVFKPDIYELDSALIERWRQN
jgi:murein L,D-transpeptidase YcbB/YkuD